MSTDAREIDWKRIFLNGAMAGLLVGALFGGMVGWKLSHAEAAPLVEQTDDCPDA